MLEKVLAVRQSTTAQVKFGSKCEVLIPSHVFRVVSVLGHSSTAFGTRICANDAAPLFDHRVSAGENPECSQPQVQRPLFGI
jgi:hypothetical protein